MTESSNENRDRIGGLLLAAGSSSRLGEPKQLLQFHGKTLLRRAAETLVDSQCSPVVVVVGAEIDGSKAEIAGLDAVFVINENWQTGMSSSIKAGLNKLLKIAPDLDAAIIALCDQPLVTAAHINELARDFRLHRSPIVAASYGETIGVPALFSRELFDDLLQLKGDKGARGIIQNRRNDVRTVNVDEAAFDIDTLDDVKRLTSPQI